MNQIDPREHFQEIVMTSRKVLAREGHRATASQKAVSGNHSVKEMMRHPIGRNVFQNHLKEVEKEAKALTDRLEELAQDPLAKANLLIKAQSDQEVFQKALTRKEMRVTSHKVIDHSANAVQDLIRINLNVFPKKEKIKGRLEKSHDLSVQMAHENFQNHLKNVKARNLFAKAALMVNQNHTSKKKMVRKILFNEAVALLMKVLRNQKSFQKIRL